MIKITYIEANGDEQTVEAKVGQTLMEVATKNGVPGIAADCGGSCACGTCRVYVPIAWQSRLGQANEEEQAMIEYTADSQSNTRLSCQVKITADLDGLVVYLPENQH